MQPGAKTVLSGTGEGAGSSSDTRHTDEAAAVSAEAHAETKRQAVRQSLKGRVAIRQRE